MRLDPLDGLKFPHEFSGGQRQRIAIARALASKPEFIVCDEPTSALDVSVQAQVLNLMRDLQEQFGLTYLFISHNLAVIRHMATRVGVLYLGRLGEIAPAKDLFRDPRHPYTQMLLAAVPDLHGMGGRAPVSGEIANPIAPPPGCTFHPRCPLMNERCRTEVPELLPAGSSRRATRSKRAGSSLSILRSSMTAPAKKPFAVGSIWWDWFTSANAACGTGAIFAVMRYLISVEVIYLHLACALVVAALAFDVLDGRAARWRQKSSAIGRELDSLADVISFGVAPAAIAYGCGMRGL